MKIIIGILVFCVVLFMYLHIFFHLKTSDDLEVFEIDQPSKEKFEEICDLRQPVIFNSVSENIMNNCNLDKINKSYGAFDVKIRNVKENSDNKEIYVPITMNASHHVFQKDEDSKFFSEKNQDFLEETGNIKHYKYNDEFLRPYMISSNKYDILLGSKDVTTPFRYELSYRNFFAVTQGDITIKLAPPKSSKYLYLIKDYDNFEFRSSINPWNVDAKYQADFDKIKCLEVNLKKGDIIYIPSYWWYSIKFGDETSICKFQYKTYMNTIAILPQLFMQLLQNQNIKREIVKKKIL
jgi:hypothetical protein